MYQCITVQGSPKKDITSMSVHSKNVYFVTGMLSSLFLMLGYVSDKYAIIVYERFEWKKTLALEHIARPTLDMLHLILRQPNSPILCTLKISQFQMPTYEEF
jgi:hypothetical protein